MALLAIRTILNPLDLAFGHSRAPRRRYRPFDSSAPITRCAPRFRAHINAFIGKYQSKREAEN
jgi:hypothetical protein